jgi:hypothetical protein
MDSKPVAFLEVQPVAADVSESLPGLSFFFHGQEDCKESGVLAGFPNGGVSMKPSPLCSLFIAGRGDKQ